MNERSQSPINHHTNLGQAVADGCVVCVVPAAKVSSKTRQLTVLEADSAARIGREAKSREVLLLQVAELQRKLAETKDPVRWFRPTAEEKVRLMYSVNDVLCVGSIRSAAVRSRCGGSRAA